MLRTERGGPVKLDLPPVSYVFPYNGLTCTELAEPARHSINDIVGGHPQYVDRPLPDNQARRFAKSLSFAYAVTAQSIAIALTEKDYLTLRTHAFLRRASGTRDCTGRAWYIIGGHRVSKTFALFLVSHLEQVIGLDPRTQKSEIAKQPSLEILQAICNCKGGKILAERGPSGYRVKRGTNLPIELAALRNQFRQVEDRLSALPLDAWRSARGGHGPTYCGLIVRRRRIQDNPGQ